MNLLLRVVSMNLDFRFAGVKVLSAEAWTVLLLLSVLVFHGRLYLRRSLFPVYIYAAIVLMMHTLGHLQGSSAVWPMAHVRPLLFAVILYQLYVEEFDRHSVRVLIFSVLFVVVTLGLNVYGLYRHPIAVREIVGGSAGSEITQAYARLGIEGYGFFSGLPPLIPAVVYAIRKSSRFTVKLVGYLFIILSALAIILSTVTTPLILMMLGLIGALMIGSLMNRFQAMAIAIFVLLIIVSFGPNRILRSAIPVLISISPSNDVALRLRDVDYALAGNFEVSETSTELTTFETRFQRVFWNLEAFSRNPILGASSQNHSAAYHLYWFYLLASLGLVGAFPYFYYIYKNVVSTSKRIDKEAGAYYMLSIALFIMMGLAKNVTGWFMYLVPFFIVPGLITWQYQESIKLTKIRTYNQLANHSDRAHEGETIMPKVGHHER